MSREILKQTLRDRVLIILIRSWKAFGLFLKMHLSAFSTTGIHGALPGPVIGALD
jgi:hypothetical protein